MDCPNCGADLSGHPERCPGCGRLIRYKNAPRQPESEPAPRVSLVKIRTAIAILAICIVLLVVLAVVLFTQPLGKIQLVLVNESSSWTYDTVHVGIYLDGTLCEIVYIEAGDSYTHIYKLTRGTHTVGFDFSYSSLYDIDGVVDALYSFELMLLHPQTLSYSLNP